MLHAVVPCPVVIALPEALEILAVLLLLVVIYMAYKIIWHPDFGLPVRRRIFKRGLLVERDQIALVPFWWSNLRVSRAIARYWKQSLRENFDGPRSTLIGNGGLKDREPPPTGDGP